MRTKMTIGVVVGFALMSAIVAQAQTRHNGFSVVVLLGETQNAAAGESLPPAPALRKALTDVKDFLPYRGYRVLDTQWLRGGSTRMKGLDDQEYDVDVSGDEIMPNPFHPKEGMLTVQFKLQEVGAAMNASEEFGRSVQAADLERQLQSAKARIAMPQSAEMKKVIADDMTRLEKMIRLARARKLIDSKFEMAPGETVVVGTSKIGSDRGLVVLLTAVAAGAK